MNTEPNTNGITDNPELTAYALGELEPDRVDAMEQLIEQNPEAASFVEDVRRTADELTADLLAGPSVALSDAQREAIEDAAAQDLPVEPDYPHPFTFRKWAPLGVAASVAVVTGAGLWFNPLDEPTKDFGSVAMIEPLRSQVSGISPGDGFSQDKPVPVADTKNPEANARGKDNLQRDLNVGAKLAENSAGTVRGRLARAGADLSNPDGESQLVSPDSPANPADSYRIAGREGRRADGSQAAGAVPQRVAQLGDTLGVSGAVVESDAGVQNNRALPLEGLEITGKTSAGIGTVNNVVVDNGVVAGGVNESFTDFGSALQGDRGEKITNLTLGDGDGAPDYQFQAGTLDVQRTLGQSSTPQPVAQTNTSTATPSPTPTSFPKMNYGPETSQIVDASGVPQQKPTAALAVRGSSPAGNPVDGSDLTFELSFSNPASKASETPTPATAPALAGTAQLSSLAAITPMSGVAGSQRGRQAGQPTTVSEDRLSYAGGGVVVTETESLDRGYTAAPQQNEAELRQEIAAREVALKLVTAEQNAIQTRFGAYVVEGKLEAAKAGALGQDLDAIVTSSDHLGERPDAPVAGKALEGRRRVGGVALQESINSLQRAGVDINAELQELEVKRLQSAVELQQLKRTLERIRQPRQQLRVKPESSNESYLPIIDNPFKRVTQAPLSTFSIDVDTGAYTNARRFITRSQLPPRDSVRIEEMINYFKYDYEAPVGDGGTPFATHVEVASAPWDTRHRLVRVGIKGHEMHIDERPPSNLVFLMDVSGSMSSQDKLPLLKKSMKMLVDKLSENDRVAIVVYAGASGLVLDSTTASNKALVLESLQRLNAGGSTNGGAGIELAYSLATQNFIEGGVNRVVLATDGDFNVGTTSHDDLMKLIERKRKSGVFLSVLGFGTGNLKDSTMEQLANKGNGSYHYIDRLSEGRRVLVEQAAGTLVTIAKDVKIQIEFNPSIVQSYRLIGYENRVMAAKDFNDDTKDAGEIGAGHTVTALYEVVPTANAAANLDLPAPDRPINVDPLKYQQPATPVVEPVIERELTDAAATGEMLTVKLRYKLPDEDVSTKLEIPVTDQGASFEAASDDFRFASSVAGFGMILRQSPHRGDTTLGQVIQWAERSMGDDRGGYRREFIDLVNKVDQMR